VKAKLLTLFVLSMTIGLAVVLVGCHPSTPMATPVLPTSTTLPPTSTPLPPTPTTLPPTPTATPTPIPEPPEAPQAALYLLASQFRVSMEQVHLVHWEQIDWPNGCLGIPMRDACIETIVPGYRIVVEISGQEYEYRSTLSDARPYRLLLAAGPDPGIKEPALIWEGQEDDGCQSLLLAADGRAAMGPCDAPHAMRPLLEEMGRPQQWADLLARFAPVEAETSSGWIKFQGQGQETATPAWQRAIAAWGRLVRQELLFGRSGASWGAALAWHQGIPEQAGYCKFLQVEVYGFAFASTARCEGGDARDLGQGWLKMAEWEQFDAWFYGRAPVYRQGLDFFSTGHQEMNESEIDALRRWTEGVYNRLAVEASAPAFATTCPHIPLGGFYDVWRNEQVWPRLGCAVEAAIPINGTEAYLCCNVHSIWIREKRLFVVLESNRWAFVADESGLPAEAVFVTPTWQPPTATPGPPPPTPVPTPTQVPPPIPLMATPAPAPSPTQPSATPAGAQPPLSTVVLMTRFSWPLSELCFRASGRHGWLANMPPWAEECRGLSASNETLFSGAMERFEGGWLLWNGNVCFVLFADGTWTMF